MKRFFALGLMIVFSVALFSCGGSSPKDVYVAGYYTDNTTHNNVACYWKNGTKTDLETTAVSKANNIFVSGADVYVSGTFNDGVNDVACYWKNGTRVILDAGAGPSDATSIYYDGTHLYAGGFYESTGHDYIACLWIDDVRIDLGVAGTNSSVNSILVVGEMVYAAGHVANMPTYLKYNVTTKTVVSTIVAQSEGMLYGIAMNGPDIYLSGTTSDGTALIGAYWKNDVITEVTKAPDYAEIIGIALDKTGIYVAGTLSVGEDLAPKPMYWKDGVSVPVTTRNADDLGALTGIQVVDGDVYTTGYYTDAIGGGVTPTYSMPAYWVNDTKTDLLPEGTTGFARNIFVY
jgi:hypothetical protein